MHSRPMHSTDPLLEFRTAGPADVDEVVAVVESAYRGGSGRAGWTSEGHLLGGQRTDVEQVLDLLARPGSVLLLALEAGTLIACCHLEPRDPTTAYFGMFAVRPDRQGGGTGRALLDQACRLASSWGRARLRMTVIRQRSDLIAWYRRLGFEPTGETEPFPYDDERFGIPKRDDLEFVVLEGPAELGPAKPR